MESEWLFLSGGLDAASVARGVTAGQTPPNGGGSFVFGCNSLDASPGAVGLYPNFANFNPLLDDGSLPTGGSIRGAVKRGVSAGPTGFAPMLFIGLQGTTVQDSAYMLGLSDNDPHEIVLRKGALVGGLDPDGAGILRRGSETFVPDTWHHLRLDMIVNPNGDVVLKAFRNTGSVASPTWAAIPGIDQFIDDALSVNSGSAPFIGGRLGFGFETSQIERRGWFDQLECHRQK